MLDILDENEKQKFKETYEILKREILGDPTYENDEVSRQWLEEMIDYNVPGGKKHRGIFLVEVVKFFSEKPLSEEEFFRACVLGWCLQWGFASALMHDDIEDNSHTRRGKPCWFRLPKVGLRAVNDGVVLCSQTFRLIKKYMKDQPYYPELLEMVHEIVHLGSYGQMIDLISPMVDNQEEVLKKYTPELHRRISTFKTAYIGQYASFALAMTMLGKQMDEFAKEKDLLIDMGVYFQEQDDYLDCYSDFDKFGKIGSDIEDSKCSWMVVKALEICNEDQKKILYENYMNGDPESVAKVKSLYEDLNLKDLFAEHEVDTQAKLIARIEALPSKPMQTMLKKILCLSYKRQR